MQTRPKLQVELAGIDYFLEVSGLIGLALLVLLPVYYFGDLPNQIPVHINAQGEVDSYGSRGNIWLVPAIGAVLYILLSLLNRFPYLFNYPQRVTRENAMALYELGTRLVRILKTGMMFSFAILTYKTIDMAINVFSQFNRVHVLVLPALVLIWIAAVAFKMMRQ